MGKVDLPRVAGVCASSLDVCSADDFHFQYSSGQANALRGAKQQADEFARMGLEMHSVF